MLRRLKLRRSLSLIVMVLLLVSTMGSFAKAYNPPLQVIFSAPGYGQTVTGGTWISVYTVWGEDTTHWIDVSIPGWGYIGSCYNSCGFWWDASYWPNGYYTIEARASGNYPYYENAYASTWVYVYNPPPDTQAPSVSVTSPADGSWVSGSVGVSASASDNVGVSKVEFYVDGALQSTSTASPYSWTWNTFASGNGGHSITAKAYDAAGNNSSSSVSVTVDNPYDAEAPGVTITEPWDGDVVDGGTTVLVAADAWDNVGVVKVEFYVGSTLRSTDTAAPWGWNWLAPRTNGTYTLTAKAYDAAGNVGTHTITVDTWYDPIDPCLAQPLAGANSPSQAAPICPYY